MSNDDQQQAPKRGFKHFLLKAIPLTAIIAASVMYAGNRFTIGIDPQAVTCLGKRVFLIDHYDREPESGKPFQFQARHMSPHFADGTPVVKKMAGAPGDRVAVSETGVIVNGEAVAEGLPLLPKLGKPASRYERDEFLAEGKFWFMGTAPESFDSRYWGTVDEVQIVGRAYPLW